MLHKTMINLTLDTPIHTHTSNNYTANLFPLGFYVLQVLLVNPSKEVTLKGEGGKCVVEVLFSPQERMAPFSEEVQLKCLGTMCPLLVLKGCCQGVEVTLDQNYLSFGAVAQNCQATRRIMLQNTGDIGARCIYTYTCSYTPATISTHSSSGNRPFCRVPDSTLPMFEQKTHDSSDTI